MLNSFKGDTLLSKKIKASPDPFLKGFGKERGMGRGKPFSQKGFLSPYIKPNLKLLQRCLSCCKTCDRYSEGRAGA